MTNEQRKIIYEYGCGGCQEKLTTDIPDYHLNNKCLFCSSSLFAPVMYLDERLTRPIRPGIKR